MKTKNWTPDEDRILRQEIARHTPIESIARMLNKTEMALYLYTYRHRIPLRKALKNPMMRKMIEIKFGSVEFFTPTREFYKKANLSQKRWSELVFGYAQPTQDELKRVAKVINFSVDEAFRLMEARQMQLFED